MKTVSRLGLAAGGLLGSVAFLCGYTIFRLPAKPREGVVRVACVGDSLTYGCGVPLFFRRRYPAILQQLLGREFQVAVFAVNDRTLQDTGNKPFRREHAFSQSKAFLPDIVVLLLGTNDAKDRNWISTESFRRQYEALLAEYRALPKTPRILVCAPPHAFPAFFPLIDRLTDINQDRIPAIAGAVAAAAEQAGLELVDLYARTDGRRDLFGPDGLHPTGNGAKMMAEEVCRAIHTKNSEQKRQTGPA